MSSRSTSVSGSPGTPKRKPGRSTIDTAVGVLWWNDDCDGVTSGWDLCDEMWCGVKKCGVRQPKIYQYLSKRVNPTNLSSSVSYRYSDNFAHLEVELFVRHPFEASQEDRWRVPMEVQTIWNKRTWKALVGKPCEQEMQDRSSLTQHSNSEFCRSKRPKNQNNWENTQFRIPQFRTANKTARCRLTLLVKSLP